jgi:hypothetical protein
MFLDIIHLPVFINTVFFKKPTVRILDSHSVFRQNLVSWAYSIELVPVCGQLHQHKVGYTSQVQHKLSARVKKKTWKKLDTYEA